MHIIDRFGMFITCQDECDRFWTEGVVIYLHLLNSYFNLDYLGLELQNIVCM